MSVEILGQTTLESGVVVLSTTAGEFCGSDGGGRTAAENARELLLRETARFIVSVADSVADRDAGKHSVWRGRDSYDAARDLALLYMAHNPKASVAIFERVDGGVCRLFFTNNRELCQ